MPLNAWEKRYTCIPYLHDLYKLNALPRANKFSIQTIPTDQLLAIKTYELDWISGLNLVKILLFVFPPLKTCVATN